MEGNDDRKGSFGLGPNGRQMGVDFEKKADFGEAWPCYQEPYR